MDFRRNNSFLVKAMGLGNKVQVNRASGPDGDGKKCCEKVGARHTIWSDRKTKSCLRRIERISLSEGSDATYAAKYTLCNVGYEVADTKFDNQLREKAAFVDGALKRVLAGQQISGELKEALEYTLKSPGKRVRSVLVLWCCEIVRGRVNRDAEMAAAAVELVHTYSLVHDDLPAMDDDDLRRGVPTCHKAFDEATAILAGDALLTLAFEILAKEISKPGIAVRLIGELAEAAGPSGMIGGQMADLKAENGEGTEELLEYIHTNKTAKMFRCAAAMGGICGGADETQLRSLCEYGLKVGLGFQIADDILDVCGSSEHLGKTAGKDAKAAKCTYPAVVGLEESRQLAERVADEAVALLEPFGARAETLRKLAVALLERTR
ncbi:MAG: polyprenyl synthetase family protein [Planctomycetota bacterium]|jgi:geranylgeranyl pyrophosphate synthase